MNPQPAIVLVRIGGLGDLLVTLPSIALIGRALAGAAGCAGQPGEAGCRLPLKLICHPRCGVLLRESGLVDELIPAEDRALADLFAGEAAGARAREAIGPAALVVGWLQNERSPLAAARWEVLGAREACFFSPDPRGGRPLSRGFFEQTRLRLGKWRRLPKSGGSCLTGDAAGEVSFDGLARLNVTDAQVEAGLEHFGFEASKRGRFAVIHPGSGSRNKRWPLENFLAIARMLREDGLPGIVVTGEAEEDLERRLSETPLPAGWRWRGGASPLPHLAGLLVAAGLYLGNDSGVTHLAGAVGTPGLALFRREWLPAWRPFDSIRVLAAESPGDIRINGAWAAIEKILLQN